MNMNVSSVTFSRYSLRYTLVISLGSGGNPYCQNVSVNGTWEMQTVTPEPRFSVEVFFDFLAGMMAVRFVSKR